MGVTLRKKINSSGTTSLYLDIYHNGKRHKEYLDIKLIKANTPIDRQTNKQGLELAKQIATNRSLELAGNDYDVTASFKGKIDFITYFDKYIENYTKKDKKNMLGVCNKFKEFMKLKNITSLTMKQLDENIVYQFADYLKDQCQGEGASSYFARFKKMLKQAVREKIISTNPASEITIRRDESIKKEVLSIAEIAKLANAEISNKDVKHAFLFSCFTGLRWVDIVDLKWKHINLDNRTLSKVQSKTDMKVTIDLHDTALAALPEKAEPDDLVFNLPSHTGALKALKKWLEKAEIQKHITWHCARHSFGTNLVYYKTNPVTVSQLLGHSSLKYTQRYIRIADEMKKEAISNLPTVKL